MAENKQLTVWWKRFCYGDNESETYTVDSIDEAIAKLKELTDYDLKDDGVIWNMGGLQDVDGTEWHNDEGESILEYMEWLDENPQQSTPDEPAPMNKDADNDIHSVKPVKLSVAQKEAMSLIARLGAAHDFPAWMDSPMRKEFVSSTTLKALEKRGLVKATSKHVIERGAGDENIYYHRYHFTEAGTAYATERGWIAAPSTPPTDSAKAADVVKAPFVFPDPTYTCDICGEAVGCATTTDEHGSYHPECWDKRHNDRAEAYVAQAAALAALRAENEKLKAALEKERRDNAELARDNRRLGEIPYTLRMLNVARNTIARIANTSSRVEDLQRIAKDGERSIKSIEKDWMNAFPLSTQQIEIDTY